MKKEERRKKREERRDKEAKKERERKREGQNDFPPHFALFCSKFLFPFQSVAGFSTVRFFNIFSSSSSKIIFSLLSEEFF